MSLNLGLILAVALGYLLGSIPFGLLLAKATGAGDVRKIGSGNIGATNVLRTGKKGIAGATLLLDAAKGAAAVLIAGRMAPEVAAMAGAVAVAGHVFPVWLSFKGGKGVATYIGAVLALAWPVGLIGIAVWVAVAAAFRYSSLASLTATVISPFLMIVFSEPIAAMWTFGMSALIILRHRDNIRRLARGEESKIGAKSQK